MRSRVKPTGDATIYMDASIYGSIAWAVNHFDTEVAWYGDVTIIGDEDNILELRIDNVELYPQKVGMAVVHEVEAGDGFDDWYAERLAGAEGKPCLQYYGHSHVNMGCTPSATDLDMRDTDTDLGVFSIHNKRGETHWEIWRSGVIYETDDITLIVTECQLADTDRVQVKRYEASSYPIYYGKAGRWQGGRYDHLLPQSPHESLTNQLADQYRYTDWSDGYSLDEG